MILLITNVSDVFDSEFWLLSQRTNRSDLCVQIHTLRFHLLLMIQSMFPIVIVVALISKIKNIFSYVAMKYLKGRHIIHGSFTSLVECFSPNKLLWFVFESWRAAESRYTKGNLNVILNIIIILQLLRIAGGLCFLS